MSAFEDTRIYQKNAIDEQTVVVAGRKDLLKCHIRCGMCAFHYDVLDAVADLRVTMKHLDLGTFMSDVSDVLQKDFDLDETSADDSMLMGTMTSAMFTHICTLPDHRVYLEKSDR